MRLGKKLAGFLLSLALSLAMTLGVMADGAHTLTIESETSGHTYQAYQVFSGDYHEGILSNVQWGSGVDNTDGALLDALKGDGTIGGSFADCASAADVAEMLESFSTADESGKLDAFADVVSEHLKGTPAESGDATKSDTGSYTYTISGLSDGYYFVKEEEMEEQDAANNAYTKFMLQVVGNTAAKAKAEVPVLEKVIDGANDTDLSTAGDTAYNNAAMGDRVLFKLTSKVPAMDGYEKYYFVVTDTLSPGLTFNNDVTVKIGDTPLTKDTHYTVESVSDSAGAGSAEGQTVTIVFKNFIQHKTQAGQGILITYSATVNDRAAIGTAGNRNSAHLTYSNDPNQDADEGAEGNTDKPAENSPVGVTPDSDTYTYVTGLKIAKVDPEGKPLTGAEFKLAGTRLNKVLLYKDRFQEDTDGSYWKLKDGSYTTTAPVTGGGEVDTSEKYEDTTTRYSKTTVKTETTAQEDVIANAAVDNDGILRFDGLAAGEYTITEVKAPDGYNLLKAPVTITISWAAPADPSALTGCTWNVTGDGSAGENQASVENGIIILRIENESGFLLPSTGGAGTVLFYALGGLLVISAGTILLARRRRKDGKQGEHGEL